MAVAIPQESRQYGDVYISGQARVQLGDAYAANRDLFESGTEVERREGEAHPAELDEQTTANIHQRSEMHSLSMACLRESNKSHCLVLAAPLSSGCAAVLLSIG